MKLYRLLPLFALLLGPVPGCSDPTGGACSRKNTGAPCTQGSSATRTGNDWRAVIRTNSAQEVDYNDGGVRCSYTHTSCVTRECVYPGAGDNLTASQAVANCAAR